MYGALPQESSARPVAAAGTAKVSGGGGGGGAALICNALGREPRSDGATSARRLVGAKPAATASTAHSDSVLIFALLAPWRQPLQYYVDACAVVGSQRCF